MFDRAGETTAEVGIDLPCSVAGWLSNWVRTKRMLFLFLLITLYIHGPKFTLRHRRLLNCFPYGLVSWSLVRGNNTFLFISCNMGYFKEMQICQQKNYMFTQSTRCSKLCFYKRLLLLIVIKFTLSAFYFSLCIRVYGELVSGQGGILLLIQTRQRPATCSTIRHV